MKLSREARNSIPKLALKLIEDSIYYESNVDSDPETCQRVEQHTFNQIEEILTHDKSSADEFINYNSLAKRLQQASDYYLEMAYQELETDEYMMSLDEIYGSPQGDHAKNYQRDVYGLTANHLNAIAQMIAGLAGLPEDSKFESVAFRARKRAYI